MSPILPSGGARFIEAGGASASTVSGAPLQKDGSGAWVYGTSGVSTGALIDWTGTGVYEILDTSVPAVLVSDGAGGARLQAGPGVAVAIIAFNGTDLYVCSDLTQPVAADFFIANDGSAVLVKRATTPQLTASRINGVNVLIH